MAGTPLLLATLCSLSRVVENRHRVDDIVSGAILGAFIAVVIVSSIVHVCVGGAFQVPFASIKIILFLVV